jgi:hypothetical protein
LNATGLKKAGTTYQYEIELSLQEIGHLMEAALTKGFNKRSLLAFATGIARALRNSGREKRTAGV